MRTVKNFLADGSVVAFPDADGSRTVWELAYSNLSRSDMQAIEALFRKTSGRLRHFTFLDPTENLIVNSIDLRESPWVRSSLIGIQPGAVAPDGTATAFTVANTGSVDAEIAQTLPISAAYTYTFSLFASSHNADPIRLFRRSSTAEAVTEVTLNQRWTRAVSTGNLEAPDVSVTLGISLFPGQAISLYGPQLDAHPLPSFYSGTQRGGVYLNAFWASDQLQLSADGPDLFSAFLSIEAKD